MPDHLFHLAVPDTKIIEAAFAEVRQADRLYLLHVPDALATDDPLAKPLATLLGLALLGVQRVGVVTRLAPEVRIIVWPLQVLRVEPERLRWLKHAIHFLAAHHTDRVADGNSGTIDLSLSVKVMRRSLPICLTLDKGRVKGELVAADCVLDAPLEQAVELPPHELHRRTRSALDGFH